MPHLKHPLPIGSQLVGPMVPLSGVDAALPGFMSTTLPAELANHPLVHDDFFLAIPSTDVIRRTGT